MRVSVVIPAYGGQPGLDVILAALARQSYPPDLLEVVIVDDNSAPPLRLPEQRPANCRLVRAPATGWGAGHARAYGAHLATGAILCWLDSDLVPGPRHIEAHARWQHTHPEAVSLGLIYTCPQRRQYAHPRSQRLIAGTAGLARANHLGFRAYVGAATAVPRWLYETSGGLDPTLTGGQDIEFGYRLWQSGGVFVAEHRAVAWHTDTEALATLARTRAPSARLRTTRLAEVMPQPRSWRRAAVTPGARGETVVPLVRAVVPVHGFSLEEVRTTVEALLTEPTADLTVVLVAPWNDLDGLGRTSASAAMTWQEALELRLVQARYLGAQRVVFTTTSPETGFPAPYLLEVPTGQPVQPGTVRWLVTKSDRVQAGLLEWSVPGVAASVRLWRCRALSRAGRIREPGESWTRAVARIHGRYRIRAEQLNVGQGATGRGVAPLAHLPRLRAPQERRRGWRARLRGAIGRLGQVLRRAGPTGG